MLVFILPRGEKNPREDGRGRRRAVYITERHVRCLSNNYSKSSAPTTIKLKPFANPTLGGGG